MADSSRPFWSQSASLTTTPVVLYLPNGWRDLKVEVDALSYATVGSTYAAPAVASVNGVTTLTEVGGATSGTFTLKVFPGTDLETETAAIDFDATSAEVETALSDLDMFVGGDITNAGGALDSAAVTLTWTGVYAATVPPIVLGTNSLDAGRIQIHVTTNPLGNGGYGYVEADSQEVWTADPTGNKRDRFLYIATVASTGTAHISAYR